MQQYVETAPGVRLWTEQRGPADAPPLLLVMGAQASGIGWPEPFVDALAEHHRVIRYDHRDTGRSTWSFDTDPYPISALAEDVVALLDGLGIARAHLAGLSLGGMLGQLVLADHPERVASATLMGTNALSTRPYTAPDGTETPVEELPGIAPEILEFWARPVEDHGEEAELDRRVAHWRLLAGGRLPFDPEWYRDLERQIIAHTGTYTPPSAHSRADPDGLLRTEELAANRVPVQVVVAPAEPVFPPPHPHHLARCLNAVRVTEIPGMGHALPPAVQGPLAAAILAHTGATG
ncbi:alpha/beta fold hydrolase [Streptomyces catenulae]|uniref:Alpha/beta hydrolase n=1 Tax=Streptomyces catenulae TaxID=66875 RepID=A0ABV2Z1L2_9ACTN|nr:alpha/beta hydrolase [Streptomyces catenulae]